MPLRSLFKDLDNAIGSYRYSVHTVIPKATKIAWALKKNDIQRWKKILQEVQELKSLPPETNLAEKQNPQCCEPAGTETLATK